MGKSTDFQKLQNIYLAEIEHRNKFLDRVISECLSRSATDNQINSHD